MLLYQFDAAVSRVFSWSVFKKGRGFRVVGCGLWVVGCGLWVVGCGLWWQLRCNIYGAMPEGKWIAGFPFGISNH